MKRLTLFLVTIFGLVLALVLTLIVFGLPVGASLQLVWDGALGDKYAVSRTLVKTTPLLFCALGIVIAWRAGMYNIGGEGQLLIGAIAGAAIAKVGVGSMPGQALNPLVLMISAMAGAAYAFIAGWLHVFRGVQIVVSTILLNFVAMQLLRWTVSGPLQEEQKRLPLSDLLPQDVMLLRFDPQQDLHSGVFIAIFAMTGVFAYLFYTRGGFKLRLVGENPKAAQANRINPGIVQIKAMLFSGALCGLAGGVEYTGVAGQIGDGISQQWGFLAIPVALLGGLNPLGAGASSLYFGALLSGSENLGRYSGTPLVYVIQAVAVLVFVSTRAYLERRPAPVEEPV